jgi:hypothetical protein
MLSQLIQESIGKGPAVEEAQVSLVELFVFPSLNIESIAIVHQGRKHEGSKGANFTKGKATFSHLP